jgi:hypothetical protein
LRPCSNLDRVQDQSLIAQAADRTAGLAFKFTGKVIMSADVAPWPQ